MLQPIDLSVHPTLRFKTSTRSLVQSSHKDLWTPYIYYRIDFYQKRNRRKLAQGASTLILRLRKCKVIKLGNMSVIYVKHITAKSLAYG